MLCIGHMPNLDELHKISRTGTSKNLKKHRLIQDLGFIRFTKWAKKIERKSKGLFHRSADRS
jgi:hypothetical protein